MPASRPEPVWPSCVQALAVPTVPCALSAALFALWPRLDLAVAGLFYSPGTGFTLSVRPFWDWTLLATKGNSSVFAVAAVVGLSARLLRRNEDRMLWVRYWGLVVLIYLLGPGVFVNRILKSTFGRARPEQIELFGGDGPFTAEWTVSDYCHAACSFVSAIIAAATALAFGLGIGVMWLRQRPVAWLFRSLCTASLVLLLLTALHRPGSGRHFRSDLILPVLPVMALGSALTCVQTPRPTPPSHSDSQDDPR